MDVAAINEYILLAMLNWSVVKSCVISPEKIIGNHGDQISQVRDNH